MPTLVRWDKSGPGERLGAEIEAEQDPDVIMAICKEFFAKGIAPR